MAALAASGSGSRTLAAAGMRLARLFAAAAVSLNEITRKSATARNIPAVAGTTRSHLNYLCSAVGDCSGFGYMNFPAAQGWHLWTSGSVIKVTVTGTSHRGPCPQLRTILRILSTANRSCRGSGVLAG